MFEMDELVNKTWKLGKFFEKLNVEMYEWAKKKLENWVNCLRSWMFEMEELAKKTWKLGKLSDKFNVWNGRIGQ